MKERCFIHIESTMFPDDWDLTRIAIFSLIFNLSTGNSLCLLNVDWFAKICRCSSKTVRRIIHEFEDLRLVRVVREDGKPNHVQVLREPLEPIGEDEEVIQTIQYAKILKPRKQFVPPTLQEVIDYCASRNIVEKAARKAYEYYSSNNWHDSQGRQIISWKQKIIGVWDTPENKLPDEDEPFYL